MVARPRLLLLKVRLMARSTEETAREAAIAQARRFAQLRQQLLGQDGRDE